MDWYVANLHFCERSEAAQELFKAQRPAPARLVTGMGSVVGHRELCARWVANENSRFVLAEDEVGKGDHGKGYFTGFDIKEGTGVAREVNAGA